MVMAGAPEPVTSDEDLLAACRSGANEAFDVLFERYQQPLWGYFRRRLADAARAEELTQDTFVALLRGADRYQGRSSFRTYLYGIAANLLAAERRRPPQAAPSSGDFRATSPDDALWVRQAMARLDDADREVLTLREFEQLSYAEIADLLQIPVNTVRSRLFRARLALRELLLADAELERRSS
jgi:RNA polymerase sigma-70 factor, ECF subfamily